MTYAAFFVSGANAFTRGVALFFVLYCSDVRIRTLVDESEVVSRQSLQGSTAFPVLAILSITSSCVTVPLTITFCVSRFTSKDSTPAGTARGAGEQVSK
jgi:hypothetical protein